MLNAVCTTNRVGHKSTGIQDMGDVLPQGTAIRGDQFMTARKPSTNYFFWIFTLLIPALLAGCGGGGSTGSPPTPPAPISISLNPPSASLLAGGSALFTAIVTNAANPSVTWLTTGGSVVGSGNTVSFVAPQSAGTYTLTATSVADQSKSASAFITVTTVNHPPTAPVISGPVSVRPGFAVSYSAAATDPDGDSTTITWTKRPASAVVTGSQLQWIPQFSDGSPFTFEAIATDVRGAQSTAGTLAVSIQANRPPTAPIVSGPLGLQTYVASQFTLSSSDPDLDPVTFALVDFKDGLSLSGNTITWWPTPEQVGSQSFKVHAVDPSGAVSPDTTVNVVINSAFRRTASPLSTGSLTVLHDGRVMMLESSGNLALYPIFYNSTTDVWTRSTTAKTRLIVDTRLGFNSAPALLGDGRVVETGVGQFVGAQGNGLGDLFTPSTGVWTPMVIPGTFQWWGVSAVSTDAGEVLVLGTNTYGAPVVFICTTAVQWIQITSIGFPSYNSEGLLARTPVGSIYSLRYIYAFHYEGSNLSTFLGSIDPNNRTDSTPFAFIPNFRVEQIFCDVDRVAALGVEPGTVNKIAIKLYDFGISNIPTIYIPNTTTYNIAAYQIRPGKLLLFVPRNEDPVTMTDLYLLDILQPSLKLLSPVLPNLQIHQGTMLQNGELLIIGGSGGMRIKVSDPLFN